MPPSRTDPGATPGAARAGGRPLVCLHGWSLSPAVFAGLVEGLGRERRVLLPDLRGHGARAGEPAGRFGLADLALDLAELLEAEDVRDAILLGWSLGAQVALAALPRVRARLAGLVLVAATPRFTQSEDWPHGLPAQAVEVLALRVRRDPARALARFFDGMFAEGELDPAGRARAAALRDAIPPPHPAAAAAGLEILRDADLRAALPALDLPALVVHGARDPLCPAGAGRALAAAIPGARLALLPGAGHAPFLSRPAEVRALLDAILDAP
jgi:pimeloyl-ACP methyl ester esterase